jgi:glycosyltransferase involved in cell wall biosynthesis
MAPSLEKRGGVSDFCKMLVNHLDRDFEATYFAVGSRLEKEPLWSRPVTLIGNALRLVALLRVRRFDLVQLNPSLVKYSLIRESVHLLLLKAFRLARKTIVFFHGWDPLLAKRIRHNPIWRAAFVKIYSQAALVFVLYKTCRDQLIQLGLDPEKIKITTTMYEGAEEPKVQRGQEYASNGKVQILFMSRLLSEKGVFASAEVGRLLAESGRRDFRVVLAGDGKESRKLKDYILENGLREYIFAPGFVSGLLKKRLLAESDIFLFPTIYNEGCPVVILEAMGAGQAIVSTPVGAIAEIVKHNENGFLISSRDPRDFYEAVDRLIENRKLLRRIQKLNKIKAQQNFEAAVVTRKLESFYRSIAHA